MHLKSTILIAFLAIGCLSCKKSGTTNPEEKKETRKVLDRIIQVSADQPANSASFVNLSYDEKGGLTSIKAPSYEYIYTYKLNQLSLISYKTTTGEVIREVTYENNQIKRITSVFSTPGLPKKTVVHECYYEGNKLTGVERIESGLVIAKYTYQYSGDRFVKTIVKDAVYETVFDYTFDDKKHIHHGIDYATVQIMNLIDVRASMPNNMLTQKYALYQDGVKRQSDETSYQYTYDADGYPITCIKTWIHPSRTAPEITRYTYEYKILEI